MIIVFWVKSVGAVLIVAATTMLGFSKGYCYEQRIENLKHLLTTMERIQGDLKFNKLPFVLSLKRLSERTQGKFRFYFEKIISLMEESNINLSKAWTEAAIECDEQLKGLYMEQSDLDKLKEVGQQMVSSDEKSINELFGNYISELKKRIEQLEEDKKNRLKIYRTFGVIIGIFILIVVM